MPNPYFQFREFTVYHDKCAMKVTTDACLFGAWFAEKKIVAKNVLDIGGGTGLLTLMLAQKMPARFQVIEKDEEAFQQMAQNIRASPWSNRIQGIHADVLQHEFEETFDFIITNPPFYENELKSPDTRKNMAMHSTALTLNRLVEILSTLVSRNGSFGILLPCFKVRDFAGLAGEKGFYLVEHLQVKQTTDHDHFRSILHFSREKPVSALIQNLEIKNSSGVYTEAFRSLLKDYYLYL